MTHAIERTSPKGGPFRGTCRKCGARDLGTGAALEACPSDGVVSDEQILLDMIAGPSEPQPDPRDEVIKGLVEALEGYKSRSRRIPFDLAVSSDAALAAAKAVQHG